MLVKENVISEGAEPVNEHGGTDRTENKYRSLFEKANFKVLVTTKHEYKARAQDGVEYDYESVYWRLAPQK